MWGGTQMDALNASLIIKPQRGRAGSEECFMALWLKYLKQQPQPHTPVVMTLWVFIFVFIHFVFDTSCCVRLLAYREITERAGILASLQQLRCSQRRSLQFLRQITMLGSWVSEGGTDLPVCVPAGGIQSRGHQLAQHRLHRQHRLH